MRRLGAGMQVAFVAFQAGWFVESLWTQTLVLHAAYAQGSVPAQPGLVAVTGPTSLGDSGGTCIRLRQSAGST